MTRSCSISTSPALTASGSILMASTCLRPSILTVTVPPPAEASTTVCSIFFCSTSYCCLACDISSCKLNPDIRKFVIGNLKVRGLLNYKLQIANYKLVSSFLPIIDHGADFRSEFVLQVLHDRVLFGSAPGRFRLFS